MLLMDYDYIDISKRLSLKLILIEILVKFDETLNIDYRLI